MIKMKRIFSTSLRIRQCSSSTNSLTASDMVKSSKSTKKRVGIVSRINAFALGLALTSGFGLYQLSYDIENVRNQVEKTYSIVGREKQ